ncbi:MAG: fused MFS/spermidine synthase [Gammaproteobacteria bacterium]|nr:fused MFS/spermidine synthase [Gammaproteobacteria bacterium]
MITALLIPLYALSGTVSLAYEVLWARLISMQFGTSSFAVVVTVAAFMAGLGAGSLYGVRLIQRTRRPALWLFAALEAAIAGYGLLMPWLMELFSNGLTTISAGIGLFPWYLLQGTLLLVIMLLPAVLMGVGFALMLRAAQQHGISNALAWIYGGNAAGGVLGALIVLWLLPAIGWIAAVQFIASLGLLVAAGVASLAWRYQANEAEVMRQPAATNPDISWQHWLPYAGIGAASLIIEISWTRLYGMIMLRTEYVLALILAIFIAGIALGSLLAQRMRSRHWLTVMPVIAAGFGIISLWLLPWLSAVLEQQQFTGLGRALLVQGALLAVVTLPLTVVLGAWLPLLTAQLGNEAANGAWLYGVNSLGAAAGALLCGLVLIPLLGTPASIVLASLLLFGCGMVWVTVQRMWLLAFVLMAAAWPVRDWPATRTLLPAAQADSVDLYRFEDALSITHVVERPDGQRVLLSDLQRMDASSDPTSVALQRNQARLPLVLQPQARQVLLLGLGTGITASGGLAMPARLTAVELSQGAIDAAGTWFPRVNDQVTQQARIIRGDVRRFLMTDAGHYDVIIGDVFHPDQIGRSALLSVQQFQRCRARLAADGVMVQWLALNQFDVATLRSVLRSFRRAFPHSLLFLDGFRLALVGVNGAGFSAAPALAVLQQWPETQRAALTGGEGVMPWLGRYWGEIADDPGRVEDEWRPHLEFDLPRARYRGDIDMVRVMEWLLTQRPPVAAAAQQLGLNGGEGSPFERSYIAMDLTARSWLLMLQGRGAEAARLARFAYSADPRNRWVTVTLADHMMESLPQMIRQGINERQALQAVLQVRPDHIEALRALWQLEQQAGNTAAAQQYQRRWQALDPYGRMPQRIGG